MGSPGATPEIYLGNDSRKHQWGGGEVRQESKGASKGCVVTSTTAVLRGAAPWGPVGLGIEHTPQTTLSGVRELGSLCTNAHQSLFQGCYYWGPCGFQGAFPLSYAGESCHLGFSESPQPRDVHSGHSSPRRWWRQERRCSGPYVGSLRRALRPSTKPRKQKALVLRLLECVPGRLQGS